MQIEKFLAQRGQRRLSGVKPDAGKHCPDRYLQNFRKMEALTVGGPTTPPVPEQRLAAVLDFKTRQNCNVSHKLA